MKIEIDTLVTDGMQVRAGMDEKAIVEYAAALRDGTVFPPVVVYETMNHVRYLADGFHRVAAARLAGFAEIEAHVTAGSHADALAFAFKANRFNGVRMTNEDKRHALEIAWENREELFGGIPSKRKLADVCGVGTSLALEFIAAKSGVDDSSTPPLCKIDTPETPVPEEVTDDPLGNLARTQLGHGQDRYGSYIPENIREVFHAKGLNDTIRLARNLKKSILFHREHEDRSFMGVPQLVLVDMQNLLNRLVLSRPWCVCRRCAGEGCHACSGTGFQTRRQYEANPNEFKAVQDR